MNRLEIPEFAEKKELFQFLVANKKTLIAQKKNIIKEGDGFAFIGVGTEEKKLNAVKQLGTPMMNDALPDSIQVKAIINTTNWLDSHYDVHIPGIWDKSLNENKMIMHVQEHKSNEFKSIIADGDQLKATAETMTWRSLGVNLNGKTQALVFDSTVLKERNEYMLNQYLKGYVKNHSVGMRYINIVLCINDEANGAEFEAWEKYYPMIVNKERADELGFFWAVKEAKVIEGSAVPLGSNVITPTISVESKSGAGITTPKQEAVLNTSNFNYFSNLKF